jgi:putative nucleotidyltransferase with HDIG domain
MKDSLKEHVQKITKLPTIPVIAQEILSLTDDDLVSVKKLEKIVENDPAISAKILSVANSAYFGFKVPAKTLSSAIFRIGFNNVRNIALGISIMTVLGDDRHKKALNYQRVFNHSITVGLVSKAICKYLKLNFEEEIMIGGILHDIGFLVLNRYFSDIYQKVLHTFKSETSLLESEKMVFDFTHVDIGNWLAEKWNLPDNVMEATLYHHIPSYAKNNLKHIAVIHISDYITSQHILSVTEKNPYYPFDPSCLDILGITENHFEEIEVEIRKGSFYNKLFK